MDRADALKRKRLEPPGGSGVPATKRPTLDDGRGSADLATLYARWSALTDGADGSEGEAAFQALLDAAQGGRGAACCALAPAARRPADTRAPLMAPHVRRSHHHTPT